ncbi:MAG: chemotaxis protein CheC [Defluviitaleaceae bacterium]|nr:chemotaxis protein CheC [Defluviitaleaceae bacterium]
MGEEFKFDNLQFSMLQELANIGAGNAITSLSKLIGKEIGMDISNVQILSFNDTSTALGGADMPVAAVIVNISSDDIKGMVMFIIEIEKALPLVGILMNKDINELDEIGKSALNEIGNILISSYTGALSTLFNSEIEITVPTLVIDMAGSILSIPATEFARVSDNALFIESIFNTNEKGISGYFILIPDNNSFKFMFQKLGLKV